MKQIKVSVIEDQDISRQYDFSFYPSEGLYLWHTGMNLVQVCNGAVMTLFCGIDVSVMNSADGGASGGGGEGISADTLLKAIAVAQNPDLILSI